MGDSHRHGNDNVRRRDNREYAPTQDETGMGQTDGRAPTTIATDVLGRSRARNLRQFRSGDTTPEGQCGEKQEVIFNVSLRTSLEDGALSTGGENHWSGRREFRMCGEEEVGDHKDEARSSQLGIPNVYIPKPMGRNGVWMHWRVNHWWARRLDC